MSGTPEQFRLIAKEVAAYIILSHAYVHLALQSSTEDAQARVLSARGELQNSMKHASFMIAMDVQDYWTGGYE